MKGYRTIIANGAVAAVPVLDYIANDGALVAALAGPNAALVLSVVGLLNVALRMITTTPVGEKE